MGAAQIAILLTAWASLATLGCLYWWLTAIEARRFAEAQRLRANWQEDENIRLRQYLKSLRQPQLDAMIRAHSVTVPQAGRRRRRRTVVPYLRSVRSLDDLTEPAPGGGVSTGPQ